MGWERRPSGVETKPKRRSECCSVTTRYDYLGNKTIKFMKSTFSHSINIKQRHRLAVPLNTLKRRFVEKNCLLVNHYAGSVPTL